MEKEKVKLLFHGILQGLQRMHFKHAVKISRMVDTTIILLHIVARGIKTAEYKKKEDNLKKICSEASNKYDWRLITS